MLSHQLPLVAHPIAPTKTHHQTCFKTTNYPSFAMPNDNYSIRQNQNARKANAIKTKYAIILALLLMTAILSLELSERYDFHRAWALLPLLAFSIQMHRFIRELNKYSSASAPFASIPNALRNARLDAIRRKKLARRKARTNS